MGSKVYVTCMCIFSPSNGQFSYYITTYIALDIWVVIPKTLVSQIGLSDHSGFWSGKVIVQCLAVIVCPALASAHMLGE